jgi:hypothetical protein
LHEEDAVMPNTSDIWKVDRNKAFHHHCNNGTNFACENSFLGGPIRVQIREGTTVAGLAQDIAEMIGWHGVNIWPNLYPSGFSGYYRLNFVYHNDKGDIIDLSEMEIAGT